MAVNHGVVGSNPIIDVYIATLLAEKVDALNSKFNLLIGAGSTPVKGKFKNKQKAKKHMRRCIKLQI